MTEICGPKQSESSGFADRNTFSSKMSPDSSRRGWIAKWNGKYWETPQKSLFHTSEPFSETFSKSGTMQSGRVYPLKIAVRHTRGNGCGLWPTPTVAEADKIPNKANYGQIGLSNHPRIRGLPDREKATKSRGGKKMKWPTPHGFSKDGKSNGPSGNELGYAVNRSTWPTPQMRDYRNQHGQDSDAFNKRKEHKRGVSLVEENQRRGNIGQLNPDWVAWLMGFPIGWTSLEPMTEMIWLDWSVDPADLEKPLELATPTATMTIRSDKVLDSNRIPQPNEFATGKLPKNAGNDLEKYQNRPISTGPIPRVATGIKDRVNRLKALGNGQVPLCAAVAWEILKP